MYSVCLSPVPKPRTGRALRNTAELHPPSGSCVSTLCRRLRPWLVSFPHKVKITTCSTSELEERFWWDRIAPEGSGTAHIHLTKKKIYVRNIKGQQQRSIYFDLYRIYSAYQRYGSGNCCRAQRGNRSLSLLCEHPQVCGGCNPEAFVP